MIAKVDSACLVGMRAARVQVEVNLANGLPSFSIVGLPDTSVREARDRVMAAIRNTGFEFPSRRVTVNLAPADLRKEGPSFDLAIAVGILLASDAVQPRRWPCCVWLGELALDGAVRPIRGALAMARSLSAHSPCRLVIPEANADELSYVDGARLFAFSHLSEIVEWLNEETDRPPLLSRKPWAPDDDPSALDLSDIKGQALAKRALEIAAAGHHNVLMMGSPGTGKTLLARSMASILPRWSLDDALDATQVHSVAGSWSDQGLLPHRPFRQPHQTVSASALIGGGDIPMPGEISLAHRGILFLDELPEFQRSVLEALRQPLEEGAVHIHRTRGRATYPSEFLLLAAMNPCPCGYRGHPKKECTCPSYKIQRYMSKISGPLLERIDLHVEVPVLKTSELMNDGGEGAEGSNTVRERVERARAVQAVRFSKSLRPRTNATLRGRELKQFCALDPAGRELIEAVSEKFGLSVRLFDRVRRVARTIADLAGREAIEVQDLAEAIQFRPLDKT